MNCARAQSNVLSKSANPWRSKLLRAASERNLNLLIPVGNGAFPDEGVVKVKKRAFCWASAVSGFYELDLGANAGGEILAANLNRLESSIGQATPEELKASLQSTGVRLAGEEELGEGGRQIRFWRVF